MKLRFGVGLDCRCCMFVVVVVYLYNETKILLQ